VREEGVILEDVANASLVEWYFPSVTPVTLKKDAPVQTDKTFVRTC
jgi:hypothetical protein